MLHIGDVKAYLGLGELTATIRLGDVEVGTLYLDEFHLDTSSTETLDEQLMGHLRKAFADPELLTGDSTGEALPEAPTCSDHLLVQHRDGKPEWCETCGLTADGAHQSDLPGLGNA